MTCILLIEDSPTQAAVFAKMLEDAGFDVEHADTLAAGLMALDGGKIDAVLLDLMLPDSAGLQTVLSTHANSPDTPIVVLTHTDDEALAASALQQGAQDYLVKGEMNQSWLVRAIRNALVRPRAANRQADRKEEKERPGAVVEFSTAGDVVVAHVRMRRLLDAREVATLTELLLRRITSGCRKLVISLAQVEYVSNGAWGALLAVRRRMQTEQGALRLCNVNDGVRDQLTVRKFHRLFEIYPDLDSARKDWA